MSLKTKAFLIWLFIPYVGAVALMAIWEWSSPENFLTPKWPDSLFIHAAILGPAALAAAIGVLVVWGLPAGKPILTAATGCVTSLIVIPVVAMIGMTVYGRPLDDFGWFLEAAVLLAPCALVGAIVGWLRSKDLPAPEEWWPRPHP